jgi:transcriptional regulator with XRE-family HTH domain
MVKVRATLTLRNEAMLAARERLGLSQAVLAEMAGVSLYDIGKFEHFDYRVDSELYMVDRLAQRAARIAGVLELDVDDVLPPDLRGKAVVHKHVRQVEVEPGLLLSGVGESSARAALPDGGLGDSWDLPPLGSALGDALRSLPWNQREVLRLRFGLGGGEPMTLDATAGVLGISARDVRRAEDMGMKAMRASGLGDYL